MTTTTISLATAQKLSALAQEPTRVLRWSRRNRQALYRRCLKLYSACLAGTVVFEGVPASKQAAAEYRLARIARILYTAADRAQYLTYDELLERDVPQF